MYSKRLMPLLISTVLAFFIPAVTGKSTSTPIITFTCENNRGIPVTNAQNNTGKTQTIFYWQSDAFSDYIKPYGLCHSVTEKLNDYATQNNDSSLLILQPTEQAGLPTICITETGFSCDVVLFTLAPSEAPIYQAHKTLSLILNQEVSESSQEVARNNQSEKLFSVNLFTNDLNSRQ